MKVLVTGGAGFIGSNLVKALLQRGNEVTVLDNLSSGYKQNISDLPHVNFIEGDIRNSTLVNDLLKGIDILFHLAASVGNKRSINNPFLDADINVIGTLNLLEAARKHQVRQFIFSSSAGIYGELKTLPIKENHSIEPRTPYTCSKLYAEKIALTYADLYQMEVICLRYFNVYGPHQRFDAYGNVIPIFMFNMLQNKPIFIFGDGKQTRDFVNVADVVQANIKAAQTHASGAFNIGSGEKVTIQHLTQELMKASNIKMLIQYKNKRAGDVEHSLADISLAKERLGYNPTIDLKTGLKEYFYWASTIREPAFP